MSDGVCFTLVSKSKKAFRVQTGSSHTPLQRYLEFVGILYVYTASQSIWLLGWELALSDVETMCVNRLRLEQIETENRMFWFLSFQIS